MAALQRHNKPEYKRWVKLLKALYVVKDVLCPHVEQVLNDFHSNELIGKLGPFCCDAPTLQLVLNKATNKWSITGAPACTGTNHCTDWLDTIAAEHLHGNRKDMYKSCHLTQLATDSWEVGKTFLTPDKARGTNAPADLDPYYIIKLIAQCRLFSQPPNDIHDAVEKVLATRNELAHAAVQGINTDTEVTDKIDEMIDLVKRLPNAPTTTVGDLEKVRDGQLAEIDEELSRREMDVFRMFLEEAQQRGSEQLDGIEKNVLLFMKTNEDIWQRIQIVDQGLVEWGQQILDSLERIMHQVQYVGTKVEAGSDAVTREVQVVGREVRALDKKVDELVCQNENLSGPGRRPDGDDELRRLREELATTYQTRFANLQPVTGIDVKLPISLAYQEQTLAGREDAWRRHDRVSDIKDIFNPLREGAAVPKFLLVDGVAGLGKTSLCQRLMQDWAGLVQPPQSGPGAACRLPTEHQPGPPDQLEGAYLEHFQLVMFLRVRDLKGSNILANIQDNLLSEAWSDKERLVSCIRHNIQHVLLIIDGYDEGDERQKACVDSCLTGREMRGATIIITSRPGFCHPNPSPDRTYTLQGLDKAGQSEYIRVFDTLMGAETDGTCTQDLLTPFQGQDFLQFPLFLALVCFLARQGQGVLPKTTTDLYKHFVTFLCEKALKEPLKFGKNYVAKLQTLLEKMAFKLLTMSQSEITADVLGTYLPGSEVKATMENLCKLGLVCQEIKFKGTDTFETGTFIHQSFLDYFSARHFVSLGKKERSKFLQKTEIYHNALVFVTGVCESGGHSECFTQMLSAWKRQVEARVSLPPFDASDKLSRDMKTMYNQTCDHHSLLHAPLLWLNQLTDPAWLSADNVAAITQTTKGICLHSTHCTASCYRGLLSLIKACRDLHPSLPRSVSRIRPGPLQTLRQAFSRHRRPLSLTSQTPLHLGLYFSHQEDDNTLVYELLHHTLQSRDSVRCVGLLLPVLTREACERLSERLPDLTHLTRLGINISSWEDFVFVSRGFKPTSPLRYLSLVCCPSRSPDPPSASSLAWSPSSDFLAAISRLHQLQGIRLLDDESSLSRDSKRELRSSLRHRLPDLELIIKDWDADNNEWKLDASDSPD